MADADGGTGVSPRAAIYCRLSEEDRNKRAPEDDSASIRNQKAMLTAWCAEKHWQVYDIYSDDDYTGSDRNRPEFQRLLADARQKKFDIVLCKSLSRFTREVELVERYIHGLFPRLGIRFVSIVDNADTAAPGNKKTRQINALVNEWYLEDLSENIRSVLTSRRRDGYHIGSFALYGYRKDPEQRGHLLVDDEAAAVVREVFGQYASGTGMTAIARQLNHRGIPNPTAYKQQQGLNYRQPSGNSGLWTYSAISSLLRNEMYTGTLVQGKCGSVSYKTKENRPRPKEEWMRVPGTHEAIVSPALWAQVQARLAQNARPMATGEAGPFTGIVRCAGCGHSLRTSKSHGRRYLHCPTHRIARDDCPGCFLSVDALEESVRQELAALLACCPDSPQCVPSPLSRPRVQALIRRIEISRPAPGSRAVPVKIFWRF